MRISLQVAFSAHDAYARSMCQLVDFDVLWDRSITLAQSRLGVVDATADLPRDCPFTFDVLIADDFDLDAALAKFAATAQPDSPAP